jgi:hypothetical protein
MRKSSELLEGMTLGVKYKHAITGCAKVQCCMHRNVVSLTGENWYQSRSRTYRAAIRGLEEIHHISHVLCDPSAHLILHFRLLGLQQSTSSLFLLVKSYLSGRSFYLVNIKNLLIK